MVAMHTFLTVATDILLILHFVGIAALLGGFFAQIPALKAGTQIISAGMFHGALLMLVTGVLMVGLFAMNQGETLYGTPVNYAKYFTKLAIVVAVAALALVYRKRKVAPVPALVGIAALTFVNIVIAVVW